MDTSYSPTTRSGKDALIELLPIEIEALIIENLCRPDALTLKFCSPTFYHAKLTRTTILIPPVGSHDVSHLKCDLRKWIHRPLACGLCGQLRPSYKFTDKMKRGDSVRRRRQDNTRKNIVLGPKPKAVQAFSRFCVDCGTTPDAMGHQQYGRGTWLRIGGLSHTVCVQCNRVDLSDKKKENLCRGCWEKKTDTKPVALAIRPHPQSVVDECRMEGSRTSHGATADGADVVEASLAASDPKQFLAQMAHAHITEMNPAKTAKGTDVTRKVDTKKAKLERGVSRKFQVWHSTRIEKNKANSRSTADTTNPRKLKRNKGDWKPELPPWHNTTLLPLPVTRVDIHSNNAVSSEAFTAYINSVHIVPTIANAALSDAQLWGKMMLNARLVDQPYIKHKVGWKDGHRDRDMEDESREEEMEDEDSEEQISDEDGGVEIRDGNDEEGIKDEHSEEDISDEDGGVKIEDANDEADIKNKIPEAEEMNEACEVEVSDVERSRDKAKREEAMAQRQQTKAKRRREQAKRIRQRSLRWLSSARLSKGFGPV